MANPIDYALFAANAYSASQAVVHVKNEIPLPDGLTKGVSID